MSTYANFFDSGSTTKIEIQGDSIETSKAFTLDLINTIDKMAEIVADGIDRIPEEKRPTDVEISFALTALSAGGYAITIDQEKANFKISLCWGGGAGSIISTDPSRLMPTKS